MPSPTSFHDVRRGRKYLRRLLNTIMKSTQAVPRVSMSWNSASPRETPYSTRKEASQARVKETTHKSMACLFRQQSLASSRTLSAKTEVETPKPTSIVRRAEGQFCCWKVIYGDDAESPRICQAGRPPSLALYQYVQMPRKPADNSSHDRAAFWLISTGLHAHPP